MAARNHRGEPAMHPCTLRHTFEYAITGILVPYLLYWLDLRLW